MLGQCLRRVIYIKTKIKFIGYKVFRMATTNLNIRTDKDIKDQAEEIFNELGLNMTTAINMFLRTAIREHGIPFELKLDVPTTPEHPLAVLRLTEDWWCRYALMCGSESLPTWSCIPYFRHFSIYSIFI